MMKYVMAMASLLLMAMPVKAQDISLGLDWFVNPDHAPIIIAEELGLFKDRGLNVDIVAPSDPSEPPRLVAAGRMDMAVSYQPQLHLQREEGLPLLWAGT
jgi:ABC-type nitrate/sulfonate/bicarbonate transport systems, periplasmic components